MHRALSRLIRLITGKMPLQYVLYKVLTSKKLPSPRLAKEYQKVFKKSDLNEKYQIKEINIQTYDGFNQATHPDIVQFKGRTYMVVTPYAYCDERLENPCFYVFDVMNENKVSSCGSQPLVKWDKRKYRHHYSDPALLTDGDILWLFYRDSLHPNAKDRIDKIYFIESSNAVTWSEPKEVIIPSTRFIAPSFCRVDERVLVYYTVDDGERTSCFVGELSDNAIRPVKKLDVSNAPDDMTIWHVDVKNYGHYVGLFTYMEKAGQGRTRLYYASSNDGFHWDVKHEIPYECRKDIAVYKATSYKVNGKIVVIAALEDSKYRWRIFNMGIVE